MSVINKMLQELDRRNAVAGGGSEQGAQPVKPVGSGRGGHEWFWRITAALVLISVAWVAWVAYQLQPRTPLVTPLALKAAQQAQVSAVVAPAQEPQPVAAPAPAPVAAAPAPAPTPAETFKLARSIETPISEARPLPPKAESKKPAANSAAKPAAPLPTNVVVDRRERSKGVNERAEAHFRRAASLLNQGRVSEAEHELSAALQADSSHVSARQAYVALLLEHQRVDGALRLLREAVDLNPSQPTFSLALARVYAEQRDYPAALQVMDKAGAASSSVDFQVLRAAVLQRMGRHAEAVTAYQSALKTSTQPGTWTGLGISLEATGRPTEASQAYQRALGSGALPKEVREYAEARIRALK